MAYCLVFLLIWWLATDPCAHNICGNFSTCHYPSNNTAVYEYYCKCNAGYASPTDNGFNCTGLSAFTNSMKVLVGIIDCMLCLVFDLWINGLRKEACHIVSYDNILTWIIEVYDCSTIVAHNKQACSTIIWASIDIAYISCLAGGIWCFEIHDDLCKT